MAAQDYVAIVEQLYVSYFGRPADYFGLQNFTAQLNSIGAPKDITALNAAVQADKAGTTALSKLVNSFASSDESKALYGSDNSPIGISKFLVSVFQNVIGRTPDLGPGWDFWYNALSSGALSRADAALAIAEGALSNTTPQGLLDAQAVLNKQKVASAFTAALDTPEKINAYSTAAAVATATGLLKDVTATTDVAAYQANVLAAVDTVVSGSIPSTTSNLTTGVDTLTGTNGNDTYNAVIGNATATDDSLNALDSVDGGAGSDTLVLLDKKTTGSTLPSGIVIKNVENIVIRGAGVVNFDQTAATGITGVTKISVAQATTATVKAAGTTAVDVAGATDDVTVDGGSNVSVSLNGGTGVDTVIGATTVAKGAVSVTNTNLADANIAVDGGTSVTVTAQGVTAAAGAAGTITVGNGGAATDLPSGAIAVTSIGAAANGTAPADMAAITVKGGTKVTVVQTATADDTAAADDAAATANVITQGDIAITGGKATTEVVVQQTATSAGEDASAATAGVKTVDVVTFVKMAAGETVTVDGLVFTANKALTAAEVAAAFANLSAGATQGSAPASNGVYSGALSTHFVSAGVVASGTSQTVTFTSAKADGTATIVVADTAAAGNVAASETTAGVANVDATVGSLAVAAGKVTIADGGTKTIATVTVDGYGAGSTINSGALTTLNLAHSGAADIAVTNATANATLNLKVDGLGDTDTPTAAKIDLSAASYTTLNVTTANADSLAALIAAGATAMTVAGTNAIDLTDAATDLSGLKTLTVTGAAGVAVDLSGSANLTTVDTTGTTGTNTVGIDATVATYKGGAGVDKVTVAGNVTKAITLGAGDDVVTLATASLGANISGGDGTDTLSMTAADAESASGSSAFAAKIDGFEKLQLAAAAADTTVDLSNLDNINYVVTAGAANTFTLTLDKLAAASTVELSGAQAGGTVEAVLADATGSSDVLNVVLKTAAAAAVDFGAVVAADVETVNLTVTDTKTKTIDTFTLDLAADSATNVVVTGNANLVLNDAGHVSTKVTTLDASALTGKLTASTNGTVAETIKGGSGNDTLTAAGNHDVLNGGAGNDTLIVTGNLATLTGGAGADTFNVAHATSNVNSYATITDLTAGDIIKFANTAATETFNASKVTLADTAVFQDYANAAIAQTNQGDISWFQSGGNTYVIEHVSGAVTSFVNGTDVIVKITGTVDLSHSSFSTANQTLVFVS